MIIHLQERQIGIFSIDVDSKDYRTRDPGSVHRKVMADLARTRKGIVLFHDIQPSTARALPGLLADLKAKGYRIVHMQPKAQATTVAEFDARPRPELDKRAGHRLRPAAGQARPDLAGGRQRADGAGVGQAERAARRPSRCRHPARPAPSSGTGRPAKRCAERLSSNQAPLDADAGSRRP